MKIVVAVKQVPARDAALQVNQSSCWVNEDTLTFEINEPDAYALEEALELKSAHGGEVIVLSAGPARAAQAIRSLTDYLERNPDSLIRGKTQEKP